MKTIIHKYIQDWLGIKLIKLLPKPAIVQIRKRFRNRELVGAEIGTYLGYNAESIMKTLNIKKIYLIDPYIFHKDWDFENEMCEIKDKHLSMKNIRLQARSRMTKYPGRYEFIEQLSKDAVNKIPNELDFIYIDGAHNYNTVLNDLINYYPKIKKGGVLSGHDADYPQVTQALVKFCYENKLELNISKHEDWWIIK